MTRPDLGPMGNRYATRRVRPVILESENPQPIIVDCQGHRIRLIVDQGMRMDSPTRRYVAALVAFAINVGLDFTALQYVPTVAALTLAVQRLSAVDPTQLFNDLRVKEDGTSGFPLDGKLDFSGWQYDGWLVQTNLPA